MAKLTNSNDQLPEPVLSEFSVPDKSDLGWVPADTVFVDVAAAGLASEFVSGEIVDADDPTVIEFDLGNIQATDLIADFDLANVSETDLNSLLNSVSASLGNGDLNSGSDHDGSTIFASLNEAINNPQVTDIPASITHQTGFGLGELTVIIEDDGSDVVAI